MMASESSEVIASPRSPLGGTSLQLQEKIKRQEIAVKRLVEKVAERDGEIGKLEKRMERLEGELWRTNSLVFLVQHLSRKLRRDLSRLQQYTRRYSLVVSGLHRHPDEDADMLRREVVTILNEADSGLSIHDVDKYYRRGPKSLDMPQDLLIRFKTHAAKEMLFKNRKNMARKHIKIRPLLAKEQETVLEEANVVLERYFQKDDWTCNVMNLPQFVYADVHGVLRVKMTNKTAKGLFFRFDSVQQLVQIIGDCQSITT